MEPIIIQPRIEGENLVYDLQDAAYADGLLVSPKSN